MTTTEILTNAKQLISNPENWIQTGFAKDKNNRPTEATSSYAVKFCSVGAIIHALHFGVKGRFTAVHLHDRSEAVEALKTVIGTSGIYRWNDRATHAQVMEAFDKAIKLTVHD